MADTAYTTLNRAPQLSVQDQNFTTNAWFAKKSAGLTMTSAAGWRNPGPPTPGSYSAPMNTGTNKTMLGAVKTPASLHKNSEEMTVQIGLEGISPFGLELANKNKIVPTITYIATADTTVVAASGTVNGLELTAATGFAEGQMIEISMGSGVTAYKEYVRILTLSGTDVTFDYPLFVAPADAATVKAVQSIDYSKGGSGIEKWSGLIVNSGDEYSDRLIHFFEDIRVSQGNPELPDAAVGKITLTMDVFPKRVNGEPVFATERLQFATAA